MAIISYSGPRPLLVKVLAPAMVAFLVFLLQNIDASPLADGPLKAWLKFLAPGLIAMFMVLTDFISKKPSLNDAASKPIE